MMVTSRRTAPRPAKAQENIHIMNKYNIQTNPSSCSVMFSRYTAKIVPRFWCLTLQCWTKVPNQTREHKQTWLVHVLVCMEGRRFENVASVKVHYRTNCSGWVMIILKRLWFPWKPANVLSWPNNEPVAVPESLVAYLGCRNNK